MEGKPLHIVYVQVNMTPQASNHNPSIVRVQIPDFSQQPVELHIVLCPGPRGNLGTLDPEKVEPLQDVVQSQEQIIRLQGQKLAALAAQNQRLEEENLELKCMAQPNCWTGDIDSLEDLRQYWEPEDRA
jgi:hypothetical protein